MWGTGRAGFKPQHRRAEPKEFLHNALPAFGVGSGDRAYRSAHSTKQKFEDRVQQNAAPCAFADLLKFVDDLV